MQFSRFLAVFALSLGLVSSAFAQDPAEATLPESAPAIYQPNAIAQRVTAADVLGGGQGYVHPFLSVGEFYTDNFFNDPDEEESEWITVISPGIWVAVPGRHQPSIDVETVNTAPGGMQLSRLRVDPERRFQGYGLYRADLREHSEFPEEEEDTHRAEGQLYYRLRGGLAFELLDVFEVDQDAYGTGDNVGDRDEFTSNLWRFSVAYPVTPKLGIDLSYGMYSLDYDGERNRFRERDDQVATASAFFRVLPKTSLVLDYEYLDVEYDEDSARDSTEHRFQGGVRWDMTAKSRIFVLLGYGSREFDGDDTRDDFIGEARLDYVPTEKTKVFLRAIRRTNETDVRGARDMITHRIQAGYAQRLSARWSGGIDAYFANDDYRGGEGFQTDREDDYYGASLTFGYAFRRWLSLNLGYSYVSRDSNTEDFDYDTNTGFVSVSASL